jgi:hypothetical protein
MVHLEFGQDRLTQPQPLNALESAQGAIKGPLNDHVRKRLCNLSAS